MKPWDLIKIANRSLLRNKLRTFLTIAAIFIGSFTLTMTNGIGDGLRSYVETQVKNMEGDGVLFVRRKMETPPDDPRSDAPPEYRDETQTASGAEIDPKSMLVTQAQMQNALSDVENIKSVTPRYDIGAEYITLDNVKKYRANVAMISEGLTQKVEAGKAIDGPSQIVISLGLARALDPEINNLIGKTVTIGYKNAYRSMQIRSARVVGVATKGFQTMTASLVDAQTAASMYSDQHDPSEAGRFASFTLQLASKDAAAIESIKKKLNDKGFTADTRADQQKRTYDAIGIFKLGMGLVAAIALLAASFGIINTLVIAVLERTKEIGLQKALGMSRGRIFAIFSLESVLIGLWGALLGIMTGIIVGLIANSVLATMWSASFEGFSLFVFTIPSIFFVLVVVCLIAFFAGVLPAIRASRLHPIESLRYE